MIKIIFSALSCCLFLLISYLGSAQTHEISISAGGGLAGFNYDITNGTSKQKPGFQAGIGYTKFLNPRWGIATGLELGYYQTKATLTPNTVFSSYSVDSENDAFEFRVKTKGYEEKQKLYALNIPLMLQYQTVADGKTKFYSQAGLKFSIPLKSSFQTQADEISAAGYYPDVNAEITDLPAHGFGTQTNWNRKGDYDFNISYSLAAEAGARFRFSARSYLYTGLFIDYGLNDIKKREGQETLLTYHPTALNQSQATGVFSLANTTGDVHLMAYGIKLRIGFGSKVKAKKEAVSVIKDLPAAAPTQPVKEKEKPKAAEAVVQPEAKEKTTSEKIAQNVLTAEDIELLRTPLQFIEIGDTTLSPAAKAQADKLLDLMQRHDNIELQIEGHTCNIGSEAVNKRISLARANAVVVYLENKGIAPGRLHAIGKAAEEPVLPNTSEANRKQNRRVVIKTRE